LPVKLETSAATGGNGTSAGQYTDGYGNTFDSGLTYRLPDDSTSITTTLQAANLPKYAMLLRRLACPGMPPNPTAPGTATQPYNPYITVDYVDQFQPFDGVNNINNTTYPTGSPNHTRTAAGSCSSTGKKEPYASISAQWAAQTGAAN